jgi:hypothetical protein
LLFHSTVPNGSRQRNGHGKRTHGNALGDAVISRRVGACDGKAQFLIQ